MKIKSRKIYGQNCFDEITKPKKIFEFQKSNLIVIAHSYSGQWSARQVDIRKECLSFYSIDTLELVAHIDSLKYPVNDIDFHDEKNLVLIGTGSYDGGYFFEGELLLYNLQDNRLTKIVEDNREYTKCKFIADQIEFEVNPTHDVDNEDYTDKIYTIPVEDSKTYKIEDLNPIRIQAHNDHAYDFELFQEKLKEIPLKLSNYARLFNKTYTEKSLAWDVSFIDDNKLLIGYSGGKIGILEISKHKLDLKQIAEKGDCVQVFKNNYSETAIINKSYRDIDADNHNTIFAYNIATGETKKIAEGTFMLSKTNKDEYLARQTDYQNKNRNDILFDSSFQKVAEKRLGHYDLFNHYLRIDNCDGLYALVGNPRKQHQNKRLLEISPSTFKETVLFDIENQPNHYNNLNGILADNIFIIEGKVYNPNPYQKNYELRGIEKSGKEIWKKKVSNQSTGMTKLENHPDQVAISMTSGEILIVSKSTGETTTIPRSEAVNGYPFCISSKGHKLAVGYDNGLIEIIEIE